jgi:translation initiation factor 5B
MAQQLRQPVVVVLGHVDSGKCVSGDTLLQLADGRILRADVVFEHYRRGEPMMLPDGVVHPAEGLSLVSVSPEGVPEPRRVTHVWRLKARRLVRVETGAGYAIETTPEHKFLVSVEGGEPRFVEAERLRPGDRLLAPSLVPISPWSLDRLKSEILQRLPGELLARVDAAADEKIRGLRRGLQDAGEGGLYPISVLRELGGMLGLSGDQTYDAITHLGVDPAWFGAGGPPAWIRLPRDEEGFKALTYALGLLYGCGVEGGGLSCRSPSLVGAFRRSMEAAFGAEADPALSPNAYNATAWGAIVRLLQAVFDYPVAGPPEAVKLPDVILAMPHPLLKAFLRGFFDAAGYVHRRRHIGARHPSPTLLRQLSMALQRFGCLAHLVRGSNGPELAIEGDSIASFLTHIGFTEPGKAGMAEKLLGGRVTQGMPRACEGDPPPAGRRIVGDGNPTMGAAQPHLRAVEVVGVTTLEGEYDVYDFTVEENHSFIANGLIAHNTSLLDRIRGTAVQAREAGGMTQHIGASLFPLETIMQIIGPLAGSVRLEVRLPGLLVIDTPGHEVFSNLRMRGGSAADLAILVVDALRGFEVQTFESVEILRARRVPFVVALNKVDLIPGWRPTGSLFITEALKKQDRAVLQGLDERIYAVMGSLSTMGFDSEALHRVRDFTRQIAIVPVSAKTGEGIAELLAVLVGLAQQYLARRLRLSPGPGRGIVLELREEVGLGLTANVILLDGTLRVNDRVVVARRDGPVTARVRALYMPKPLDEMRDPRDRFSPVESVVAAAGVKLVSPDLEGVLAGSPLYVVRGEAPVDELRSAVMEEVRSVIIETDKLGVIVRADTLGSLEALVNMLRNRGVPVRRADVGPATKRDVVEAVTVKQEDPYLAALLLFNVKALPEAEREAAAHGIRVFTDPIIYNLVQNYLLWVQEERERREGEEFQRITRPCKIRVLEGYIFRRSKPAIFGIEVLSGRIKPKDRVMGAKGQFIGEVKQIQDQGRPLPEAVAGSRVAISMDEPIVDRDIKEGDILYTMPSPEEIELLRTKHLQRLGDEERETLREIIDIRRRAGTPL